MTCAEMESRRSDMLDDGALSPDTWPADVRAHLEGCPACTHRAAELKRLWQELDALNDDPGPVPPPPALITQDLEGVARARQGMPLVWIAAALVVLLMSRTLDGGIFDSGTHGGVGGMLRGPGIAGLFFALAAVVLGLGVRLSSLKARRGLALLAFIGLLFLPYALFIGGGSSKIEPLAGLDPTEGIPCFSLGLSLAMPVPVSYTHLTLPTIREV